MTSDAFVPVDFDPPTSLATEQFRLEPLGPQHNEADHAAWMSSIEHIRSTPGYPGGSWPPASGMTLEENLSDLRRHAEDFTRGVGYTFTVLDPTDNEGRRKLVNALGDLDETNPPYGVEVLVWHRAVSLADPNRLTALTIASA